MVKVSHPSKCDHGVYWPANDEVNLGCQQCNPDGMPEGPTPVLPRSTADALVQKIVPLTNCLKCGNIRTFFAPNCRLCNTPFPEVTLRGQDSPSNTKQPGACPGCGSSVHYDVLDKLGKVSKLKWQCSECDTVYRAPKNADEDEQ